MFLVKKILIMSEFFPPEVGDTARYTYFLSKELVNMGVEVKVISAGLNKSVEKRNIKGVEIIYMPSYSISDRFLYPKIKSYKLIYEILEKFEPDCVVLNDYYSKFSFLGVKAASSLGLHSIIINHQTNHVALKNKFIQRTFIKHEYHMIKKIKKLNTIFAGTSVAQMDWLKKFKINARYEISDAVDIETIAAPGMRRKLNMSRDTIMFAIKYSNELDIGRIINAIKQVHLWNGPNLALVVFGKCPKKEKNTSENVIFTGEIPNEDVLSLFEASDVYIHISKQGKSLPILLLEAAMCSCTAFSIDDGGGCLVINKEELGIAIPFEEEKLKEALQKLRLRSELRKRMSHALKNHVELKYSWSQSALALIYAICDIEGNSRRR